MEVKSIKKNYIYNLLYQVLLVLTPIITTPYLSRTLTAAGVGEVSFVESVVSYFILFATLGITTYGQREISYYQDDINKRTEAFYNIFILKFIISGIVLIIYYAFSFLIFKSNIYMAFSLSIIAVLIDTTWFFQGMEEFKLVVIRNFIFRLLNIIFILLFVKSKNDIFIYCFGLSLFTFLSNLSIIPYLKKYIGKFDVNKIHPFKDIVVVLSLFLPTVAIQIYTVLDKTMIGIITKDALENGYYEQSSKISKFLLFIVTALGTVIIPRIGYYFNKKDDKSLKELIYKSYRFVLFLSIPMSLGLFFIAESFVPWFLGIEFNKSIILIRILSFLLILIGLSNVTGLQYMVPTGKQKLLTISLCIGAIINFILNMILIRYFKSVGAAIASVVAEFSITFIQIFLVRDEISLIKILKSGIKYLISGIIMMIVLYIMKPRFDATYIGSIFATAVGAVVYVWSLFVLRDEFFIETICYFLRDKGTKVDD